MGAIKGHDPSAGTELFEQGISLVGVPAGCATAATAGALPVTGSSVPPGTRRLSVFTKGPERISRALHNDGPPRLHAAPLLLKSAATHAAGHRVSNTMDKCVHDLRPF